MRESHDAIRFDAELRTRREQQVRVGARPQTLGADCLGIDPNVDELREPCPLQHRGRRRARGHDRAPQPSEGGRLQKPVGSGQGGDAADAQAVLEQLSLAPGNRIHCVLRQAQTPPGEEERDPLETWPAVEVGVIVRVAVERHVRPVVARGGQKQWVERLRPRRSVERVAVGEHAIEVEDASTRGRREPEPAGRYGDGRQPRRGSYRVERRDLAEQRRRRPTLVRQGLGLGGNFRRREEPPIGLERSRRRIECRLPLRGGAVEIRTGCVRHRAQGHPDPGPPHQHFAALQ